MTAAFRPNFVFILADDLGYADLGCYGARHATPSLDRMASEGLRFTDGYANSALCSPSRFALMTGRYQYRLRGAAEEPLAGNAGGSALLGLPPAHPTLPSLLRASGYRTALVGKWHLGHPPHFGPLRSGYDTFFGPLGGGVDYFSHCDQQGRHDLHDGDEEVRADGYLTDILTARAVEHIHRAQCGTPFLLSVHYTAPHWPWEARGDEAESHRIGERLRHHDGGSLQTYQRMVGHLDEGVGRILATLRERGLDEQTLLVFTSDNGGERFSHMWPLAGAKMDLLEGGIRVPLLARWPGTIPAGGVSAQVAATMDWMPTLLGAAGVPAHPQYRPDGIDLMPVLREPGRRIERVMCWRMKHRAQRALRDGPWKYFSQDGKEYLFHLEHDVRERANLARRHPERFAALRACYEAWDAGMPEIPADAYVGSAGVGLARPST